MKPTSLIVLLALSLSTLQADTLSIGAIQGAGHQSPYAGKTVTTQGVVTRVYTNGFIIESKSRDPNPDTSEAIYVFQQDTRVAIGNELQVTGQVEEYVPGGEGSYNLSLTQIRLDKLRRIKTRASLPPAVALNERLTRFPPAIKQPGSGFDTSSNALDFWESLEHMRVVLTDATVAGPRTRYDEIVLRVPQATPEPTTPSGGIKLTGYDSNAARILAILSKGNPNAYNTGDRIGDPIHGNVTYSFGNYKLGISKTLSEPKPIASPLVLNQPVVPDSAFKFASFNVENLYTELPDEKFERLARIIVDSLHAPQVVALQEIHDNSGPNDDGTVDASEVLEKLVRFIRQAGGPRYRFLQISPENNADGGWPGANIRNAYLYTDAVTLGNHYLLQDPAFDVDEATAFTGTRKPLVAFFSYQDERFIFVNCHLKSKSGDTSAYGSLRPPVRFTETQRVAQTQAIRQQVEQLQHDHPNAGLVVLGDLNDFEFSPALQTLTQNGGLTNLIDTLPLAERYTYIFQGYSQVLDHILVSSKLASRSQVHVAHVNSDFSDGHRASDHDPILAWLVLR